MTFSTQKKQQFALFAIEMIEQFISKSIDKTFIVYIYIARSGL